MRLLFHSADCEGHTATPQQGMIACGYFVSTTLQHMGLNLNRYKFAQRAPINEAKTLCENDSLRTISDSLANVISAIKQQYADGIYFIGLESYHVGFLLKRQSEVFFIHSNYLAPAEVTIERASDSEALSYCSKFYLSKVSYNDALMEQWLSYNEIVTSTN